MSARSKSRKRALDVLYAAEARGVSPLVVLAERMEGPTGPDLHSYSPMGDYAESVVRGFVDHQSRVDGLLSEHSRGWTLDRMPAVDRAILRIAVYELLYSLDVPPAVVVNEAVDAAKLLSTDDSPRFVNGVLGQIALITPQLRGA
ncbi:MAG TPA: transcription antitermination factor NusB [Nakamurella sp.]